MSISSQINTIIARQGIMYTEGVPRFWLANVSQDADLGVPHSQRLFRPWAIPGTPTERLLTHQGRGCFMGMSARR